MISSTRSMRRSMRRRTPRIRISDELIREGVIECLHRGTGNYAPPAGPYADILTLELRSRPGCMVHDPDDENHRPLLLHSKWCKTRLHNWVGMKKHIGNVSNVELSEIRAGVEYEARIAPIPPRSFLCSVKDAVDREIARREACGHNIPVAEPWPMTESSATEVCKLREISANAPGNAKLMRALCCKARDPYTPLWPKWEVLFHRAQCAEDVTAFALQHNSRRLKEFSYAEFEVFRAAMETLEETLECYPQDKHPDSYAAQIRDAIEAELPRRVMVTIMLARERRSAPAPPPEHLSPAAGLATGLAAGLATGLATGLAALPSRPLEMVAEAIERQLAASNARGVVVHWEHWCSIAEAIELLGDEARRRRATLLGIAVTD